MPREFDQIKESQGRQRKKNVPAKVKIKKILELLLNSIPLTRTEISNKIDLKKSYSGQDPITDVMRILIQGNILVSKGEKREFLAKRKNTAILGRGRKSKLWEINRDLQILRNIYTDHPDLREKIRKTGWVYDVIVEQGLNPSEIDNIQQKTIQDLYKMLKLSPSFFHFCLTSPSIKQTAIQWSYILHSRGHIPSKKAAKDYIENFEPRFYPFSAYYDLFVFCNFSDENSGISTNKSYKFLEKYRQLWRERERNLSNLMIADKIQSVIIETLKRVVKCSAEDSEVFEQIKKQIAQYEYEETECKKIESGEEELKLEKIDVIVGRKERIIREIKDLLELGDVF